MIPVYLEIAESGVIYSLYVEHRDVGNVTPKRSKAHWKLYTGTKIP